MSNNSETEGYESMHDAAAGTDIVTDTETVTDTDTDTVADIFDVFGDGFDRFAFPENVYRVTAGSGGEALLIAGSERTALLDCGMAFCGRAMIDNLKRKLTEIGRKRLDYILLTHSHYDHIGALPYVTETFPDAVVYGSAYCAEVIKRPNALKLMKELGTAARDLYEPGSTEEIRTDGMSVDVILADGDELSLGDMKMTAIETKGHTNCSMSFYLEPTGLLFASESTGIIETAKTVHTPILKNYNDAMNSLAKCRSIGARYVYLPHFGMLPEYFNEEYWDMFERTCKEKLEFVRHMSDMGADEDTIVASYTEKYRNPAIEREQPLEAYYINARALVKALLKEV